MSHDLVVLKLEQGRTARPPSEEDWLRQTLDGAMQTVPAVVASTECAAAGEATAAAAQCRTALATGEPAETVHAMAQVCFDAVTRSADAARQTAAEHSTQMATIAVAVRDAVAVIGGERDLFTSSLTDAAQRFERAAQGRSVPEIQQRLFTEVANLKRITIERRAAWDRTHRELESRLSGLEQQLDVTRREAMTDALTGAVNRRAFESALADWDPPLRLSGRAGRRCRARAAA